MRSAGKDYFRRQQQLTNLGLIEWVPYLFDGESREAELIHPYGIGMGDTLEGRLCRAADEAGQALITFKQQAWAAKMALSLVPVPRVWTQLIHSLMAKMWIMARKLRLSFSKRVASLRMSFMVQKKRSTMLRIL